MKINKSSLFIIILTTLVIAGFGIRMAIASLEPKNKEKILMENKENAIAAVIAAVPQSADVEGISDLAPPNYSGRVASLSGLDLQAAAAYDLLTGDEIFSLNKNKRWPIASLSKMMTATVAIENIDPEKMIPISEIAVETEGESGSLIAGENYSLRSMIIAMMVVSSNDAAVAVSETFPKGQFVRLMNEKAKSLGMTDTHFEEPTGLSSLNQSTIEDMSRLARYVWKEHSEIFSIPKNRTITIVNASGRKNPLANINILSSRSDFLGGKTGFTDDAKQNLIAAFNIDGRPTLIMILGATDRVVEAEKIISFLKDDNTGN